MANLFIKYGRYKDARKSLEIIMSFDPYNEKAKNLLDEIKRKDVS